MLRRVLSVALVLLAAASSAGARIGYGPTVLDDATVTWQDVWEARLGVIDAPGYEFGGADIDHVSVPLSLRYGWREQTELGIGFPVAFNSSTNALYDGSGMGDLVFSMKYQMAAEYRNTPASAAEIRFGFGPDNEVASGEVSVGFGYVLSRRFARGRGHLNLEYTTWGGDPDDILGWGVGYEQKFNESGTRWTVEAVGGMGLVPRINEDITLLAGFARPMNETFEWQASAGGGLSGGAPSYIARLGLVKEFGPSAGAAFGEEEGRWEPDPGPSAAELVTRGDEAFASGDYSSAAGLYIEALEVDPEEPSAWNNLGNARYHMGDYREAKSAYNRALELSPEDADIYFNLGLVSYRLGDLSGARLAFARAVDLDPNNNLARDNLEALSDYGSGGR